jgi:hypothetical protein
VTGFAATVTADARVLVRHDGRLVTTVAGARGRRLAALLEQAAGDDERQLLLARATGNFKRGNER